MAWAAPAGGLATRFLDRAIGSSTVGDAVRGPNVAVDMTGTPSMQTDAESDPANPSLGLATARDGTVVHLRPLRRDERELVARFFSGLSAESRRRRFLQPMPRLPEPMLSRLVEVDGRRHVAMVAEVDGECAGIARFIALADEPGTAEVAVTVADRYQGRGIGRLLVEALRPVAVRAGLTSLVYLVEPTNRPALGLLRSLGVELAFRDGLVQGRQHLHLAPPHLFKQVPDLKSSGIAAWRRPQQPTRKEAPTVTIPRREGDVQQPPSSQPRPVSRRRHQRLVASSLITAPLVLLTGELLYPQFQVDPAQQLAVVAANLDRWYLAHLLSLIGFALLVPAILGLTQLVGQRRAALADLGGALALLGILAITGLLSLDGFGVWQMAQPAADRAEMAALLDRILTSPGVVPLFVVALAFPVGLLVLALGLYRSQLVPAWTAGLVAIGVAVWFSGEAAASKATMIAGSTILALGLALTGRRLLARLHPTDTAAAAGTDRASDPTAP
jgi:GNAT superfamily N-acetyltransferase